MNRARRGPRRPNPRPYVPPAPLMSNQLGLQDIDLELELLKRKREIIEQQQQMLNNDYASSNRFGEFSHMYEDRGSYGQGSSGAQKRPLVWEHESPPKRFATGNIGPPQKSYNPPFRAQVKKPNTQGGFQPRSSGYQPRSGFKPGPIPSIAKKKDFKPTKVTKSPAAPPPNKLNSYGQAERRSVVKEVMNSNLILRADRPIPNQIMGRLELALGHIIKDMRTRFPEYEEQFKNNRALKQAMRDRLRACMMGKQVTVLGETIRTYRESFPQETDKDLLLNSLEIQMGTEFVPIESDNPHEFFVKNIGRLMIKKMEEMFNKLGEIYSSKAMQKPQRKNIKESTENKNSSDVIEVDDKKPNDDDDVQVIPDEKDNEVCEIVDTDTETTPNAGDEENDEKYQKIMSTVEYRQLERRMTEMLPFLLKRIAPMLLKTMKMDAMYRKVFNGIKQDLRKKLFVDVNYYGVGENASTPKKQHLPKPIQKSDVINVEDMDKEGDKAEKQKVYQPLPYFVKILGRPSIPKRKAMQSFFEQFNPKSIKKHRSVHNILFVGFADKQDFDNILAADGTVVGRNTLTIKVSERSKQTAPQKNENPDSISINEELDDQITELLSSIKKSEGLLEEGDVEMTNDTKPDVKTENDTITNDNDPKVEITDKNDVEMQENGVTDETVQGNDAVEENVVGNDKEDADVVEIEKPEGVTQGDTAINTENVAQDSVNIDTNTEKQDGVKDNTEKSDTVIEIDENRENNVEKSQENKESDENITEIESEKNDTVNELKTEVKEVKGTPTRSSPRLAGTPSGIRTRRASKLPDNNP